MIRFLANRDDPLAVLTTASPNALLVLISRNAAMALISFRSLRNAPCPVTSKVPNGDTTVKRSMYPSATTGSCTWWFGVTTIAGGAPLPPAARLAARMAQPPWPLSPRGPG